ncbi:MAG TPA: M20/M25/M40 family metallo-hydrolase [Bacteroidota bacterium]|nr:M20/M25/M40 family metallo-hydrolase [Bacteroidota bacterium]
MKQVTGFFIVSMLAVQCASAQIETEKIDTAAISRIRTEGMEHSKSLDMLDWLTNVYGSRLTGSPEFKAAADWAAKTLTDMGVKNAHVESWGHFGRGWTLKHFSFGMTAPKSIPLIGYPKAWSPSTKGMVRGEAIYLHANSMEELNAYKGKLKGRFVLFDTIRALAPNFKANASRHTDETLLHMANADVPEPRPRVVTKADSLMRESGRVETRLMSAKLELCRREGALAILDCAHGDGGTVYVMGASVPQTDSSMKGKRLNPFDDDAPEIVPQVSMTTEHYNRIQRILSKGLPVSLELMIDADMERGQEGWNVIGEIPGTDLKDEIVMIGGHLDSWHAGSGAADDGSGAVGAMEVMRILASLDVKPRRTIRVALWGGEEQGLFGSKAYVAAHFGSREGDFRNPRGPVVKKEDYEHLSAYFNNDYGSGKLRGIYTMGNEAVRPIFRAWMKPLRDLGCETIAPQNPGGGTDHFSFDQIGLPGFQFITDPIEYGRTYHSNMDAFERVIDEDVRQAATVMAAFVYDAAMRDTKLPRKPMPQAQ